MATAALIAIVKAAQQSARQKKRGNNLFDLAFRYKDYGGSGRIYTRSVWKKHWTTPNKCDCFWIVDKVVETCRSPVTNKGKAWGWFVWKGKYYHLGERKRVRRPYKRDWREVQREEVDIPPLPERIKNSGVPPPPALLPTKGTNDPIAV
jgi:hypothetical protein